MAEEQKKLSAKEIKQLEKDLKSQPVLVWDSLKPPEKKAAFETAEDYKAFLGESKTERNAALEIIKRAEAASFVDFSVEGDHPRRMFTRMGRVAGLSVAGKRSLTEGLRLIVSHIDAPRLDLKPRPLYEDVDLAFLKTQYYGGIKKYQWLARPLALHGHVVKDDGRVIRLAIGENDDDPVFVIGRPAAHLARKVQGAKKVSEAFPGEKLNLLVGSLPLGDEKVKERFKLARAGEAL